MLGLIHDHYLLGKAMELRHLRYFIAVAEEEHITRAAERLGIQPPPLSRQIKAIEREIGVQLFHRKPRGVELTAAGRALLDDARAMLAHLDHAFDTAQRAARGEQGRISLGCTSGSGFHPLVQRIIREFRGAFPLVSVTLSEAFPDDLVDQIRDDRIDVGFIRTPVANRQNVVIDPLHEEGMVAALPRGHALARTASALSLQALTGETFAFYGSAHGTLTIQGNAVVAACQAAGFTPRVGHVVPNQLSMLNLVSAGLGVALVSASLQRMNIEGVVYRRLKGVAQLKVPLHLASRRGDTSTVVRNFLKLVKRTAKDFRANLGKAP